VKGRRLHTDWSNQGHRERAAAASRLRAERAKALIEAARARSIATEAKPVVRPGVSAPTALRYATTSEPGRWNGAAAGMPVIGAILAAVHDGLDRLLFPWPSRIGGAFVPAAIALQQARASGTLAFATFGYWPWRAGATWAARSILVNPADLLAAARRICTELRQGASWADSAVAHEDRAVMELRFDELLDNGRAHGPHKGSAERVIVRSPNLLEITPVFPPAQARTATYAADVDHVLYRVRRYTHIGKLALHDRLAAVGDPGRTPFALLGLPSRTQPEALHRFLRDTRVRRLGLRCDCR
jgi:hypothetical protein